MIGLVRRAFAGALLLFASVAMSSAEDAWVLWVRKDYDAGLESEWRIVAQFKTRKDCLDMMKARLREVRDGEDLASRDEARGSVFSVAAGGRGATALQCVNDISESKNARERSRLKPPSRVAPLIGVLLGLVSVATASAECGWVTVPPSNDRGTAGWVLTGGFRTLEECERASVALRNAGGREGAVIVPSSCACRIEWILRDVRKGQPARGTDSPKPDAKERGDAP